MNLNRYVWLSARLNKFNSKLHSAIAIGLAPMAVVVLVIIINVVEAAVKDLALLNFIPMIITTKILLLKQ
jgi:hypothetical protein